MQTQNLIGIFAGLDYFGFGVYVQNNVAAYDALAQIGQTRLRGKLLNGLTP